MRSCWECRKRCLIKVSKNSIWRFKNRTSCWKRRTKSSGCKLSKLRNWFTPAPKFSVTRSSSEIYTKSRASHLLPVQIGTSNPWTTATSTQPIARSSKCRGSISSITEGYFLSLWGLYRIVSSPANRVRLTTIRTSQFTSSQQWFLKLTSISPMMVFQSLPIKRWSRMALPWLLDKTLKANFRINITRWAWTLLTGSITL